MNMADSSFCCFMFLRCLPVLLLAAGSCFVAVAEDTDSSAASALREEAKDQKPKADGAEAPREEGSATNVVSGRDFASFKIIPDRNIFNPNRSSRSARTTTAPAAKPVKVETFSLVGTMSYGKGDLAFFDGSSSAFRKALKTNDSIAGYVITHVTSANVRLEADGVAVEVPVGGQMRRQDEGPWQLAAGTQTQAPASRSGGDSGENSGAGGGEDEILKRLLQKREEELNK